MVDLYGTLLILLLMYGFGWFLTVFVVLVGSCKSRLVFAIAHGYAVLLLLFFLQFVPLDLQEFFFVCMSWDVAAIALLLFYHFKYISKIKQLETEKLTGQI